MKKPLAVLLISAILSSLCSAFSAHSSYPMEKVETFVLPLNSIDFFETFKSYEKQEDFQSIDTLLKQERGRVSAIFRAGFDGVPKATNVVCYAESCMDDISNSSDLSQVKEHTDIVHGALETALFCNILKIADTSEYWLNQSKFDTTRRVIKEHSGELRELFNQSFAEDENKLSDAMYSLDWMTKAGRASQGLDYSYGRDLISSIDDAAKIYFKNVYPTEN